MSGAPDRLFSATFAFVDELNDFLRPARRNRRLVYAFNGKPSIKDAIEAQGIPHTEVGMIVTNGDPVDFGYHLHHGDQVVVVPASEVRDEAPALALRTKPSGVWRFVLDVHLGKLARLLRLLGFDALYRNDYDDREIVQVSIRDGRAVLTRDRRLLHARILDHGYWVRSTDPEEQLAEVVHRFDLRADFVPFSRCLVCNGRMASVAKADIFDQLEPKTQLYFDDFRRCTQCGKVYWRGGHFSHLAALINRFDTGCG